MLLLFAYAALITSLMHSGTCIVTPAVISSLYDFFTGFPVPANQENPRVLEEYDFIIVGAGSGGSVLANRLSENEEWKVLLLEAGKDEIFLTDIPLLAPVLHITDYNWGYKAEPSVPRPDGTGGYCKSMPENRCYLSRGKGLGGCSTVNFMIYSRGTRADYDSWERQGNPGWSFLDVLPYFLKSERCRLQDQDLRYHSASGLLDVTTSPFVSRLRGSFLRAAEELGFPVNKDYNGQRSTGFSIAQANLRNGRRVSASKAFLRPARNRKNLHVSIQSRVTRIHINPRTKAAESVEFLSNNRNYVVKASKEILMSAGAFNTPQILMLSGIGPREHLESLGIPVVEDLPVGFNLQDHVSMAALTFLVNDSVTIVEPRVVSNLANTLDYVIKGTGPLTLPGGAEGVAFVDTKKYFDAAEKGIDEINNEIHNTDRFPPAVGSIKVDPKYFDRKSDYDEDLADIELVFAPGAMTGDVSGGMKGLLGLSDEFFDAVFKEYLGLDAFSIVPVLMHPRSVGRVSLRSANPFDWPFLDPNYYDHQDDLDTMVRGIKLAVKLASTEAFQRYNATLLPVAFPGCQHLEFESDRYWGCVARHVSTTLGHFVGSCKMAPRENQGVVDPRLRVYGVKRLRVVDASVMPTIPTGHTGAPTMMIGEKAADMIKEDWRHKDKH